jgi:ATP-binding cassette subfamily C (CFTR/MRP) protein 1
LFYTFFCLVIANLALSTFSEKFSKKYETKINGLKKTPENVTPLLSKLSFLWIDPLIHKGFRRDLTREDIWEIENSETSQVTTQKLEIEWNKHVNAYEKELRGDRGGDTTSRITSKKTNASARYKTNPDANDEELILNGNFGEADNIKCATKSAKEPSLIFILIKVFGGKFFAGTLLKLLTDLLSFSGPLILDLIINFIKDKEQNMIVGLFLTILLFITTFSQSLILQHYYFRMYLVGARVRTALVNMIYRKSLRLSTTSRKVATVGEMTNLISVNAQLFLTLIQFLNMLWSSPFQIVICIYLLWRYLGIAAFAGLATTIIFIPLNVFATDLNKKFSVKKLNNQDLRIKVLNEMLAGIKVIKFYGWELSFQKIVNKIRNDEMKFFSRNALVGVIASFTWASAPFLVATVSYSTFVLIDDKNNLDPSTAFVSLTLFYLIRFPLALLPNTIWVCVNG